MMLIKAIILIIPVYWSAVYTTASPVNDKNKKNKEYDDAKVLYDQRQEGEWNVRAHLDNFIIMVIPSQSMTSPSSSSPTLLDFLTKSIPKGSHLKRVKHFRKQHKPDLIQEETMHFIESKTAPYHVDLTKSSTDIAPKEDVVLASTSGITVVKPEGPIHRRSTRAAKHYVLAIPASDEYVIMKHKEPKSAARKHKKTIKDKTKQELKLLGAENEQCGPGMVRDSYGICRVFKY